MQAWISPLARRTGVAIGLKSIAAHILLKWSMAGNLGDKCYRLKARQPIGLQAVILLPSSPQRGEGGPKGRMRGPHGIRYGLSLAAQGVRRWRFSPPYLPAGVFSPRGEETRLT